MDHAAGISWCDWDITPSKKKRRAGAKHAQWRLGRTSVAWIGVEMAVTKDYAARNYGVRDLVIEGLEVTAGILIVAFVMLLLSGFLGYGQFITAKVSQLTTQSQADSVGR